MGELNQNRKTKDQGPDFYEAIHNYYYKEEGQEQHTSPTKRLIQHKNTTFEHKKVVKDNITRGDYSLVYVTGPNKSYVVEPHGGQLDYRLAEKNPLKFYDQVFTQDITKHEVNEKCSNSNSNSPGKFKK